MYVCKAVLICNKCHEKIETSSTGFDPFSLSGTDDDPKEKGWTSPKVNVHLCPKCSARYLKKKEEMERELRELAGIDVVEIEI